MVQARSFTLNSTVYLDELWRFNMVTRQWAFLSGTTDTANLTLNSTEFVEPQAVVTLLEGVVVDAPSMIQIADPSIYSLGIWLPVEPVCIFGELVI